MSNSVIIVIIITIIIIIVIIIIIIPQKISENKISFIEKMGLAEKA